MSIIANGQEFDAGVVPCGHRVLVWPVPVEEKTQSGIILHAESVKRENMAQIKALVLDVGDTAWADQPGSRCWARVGDTILIAKFAGLLVKGNDEKDYRIINDLDVVAICK